MTAPLPAVAVLSTDGVTVWLTLPVVPSHSDIMKQLSPVLALVPVNAPFAVLFACGLTSIVVLPERFALEAFGVTHRLLWSTEPTPNANGLDQTLASPPVVVLVVDDQAFAFALPLIPSSALPVAAVALAAPPVVVLIVLDAADAPEFETAPSPSAVMGALTVVAPTVDELLCVVPAVMLVVPLPAVAVLVTDGVTV